MSEREREGGGVGGQNQEGLQSRSKQRYSKDQLIFHSLGSCCGNNPQLALIWRMRK